MVEQIEYFKEFEENILSKNGELNKISEELTKIENSDSINQDWDFYKNEYLIPKYGQKSFRFFMNILDKKTIEFDNYTDNIDYKYDLKLFQKTHEFLLTKIHNKFVNPLGFMQLKNAYDRRGNFIIEMVRVDGESVGVHMDFQQKIDLATGLLIQTVNEIPQFKDILSQGSLRILEGHLEHMIQKVKNYE